MKKIILLAAACAFALTSCRNNAEEHAHSHDHAHEHTHEQAHEHHHAEHSHEEHGAHEHEHEVAHNHEGHEHGHAEHNHAAAEHPVQVSVYTDSWEIYAELDPLAEGEHSHILTHVTNLADFSPASEGEVTATLSVGGHSDSQTLHFHEAGMLNFSLTPESCGEGLITFSFQGMEASAPVKVHHSKAEAEDAAIHAFATSSNGVNFTKEQSWKIDFATEAARLEPFGQVIKAVGQILPNQAEEQVVIAKATGIVNISSPVLPGMSVKAGQALMSIENSGLAESNMDVQYIEAKAEFERARDEFARKKKLAAGRIVSQSELDQAKAEFERAKAVYENLDKNYQDGKFSAISDISGYVTDVLVSNGEFVQTGQVLATVSSSQKLLVQAKVQPKWFRALQNISGANIRFSDDEHTYGLEELGGRLVSVAKASSTASPLLPVTFEIRNSSKLLPGSFADIYIKTLSNSEAVTVANGAIVEEMGNYFVYKQLTPELFEKTQVSIGGTDGQRTEITSGLEAGERVVSRGAIIVKLAQAAGGLDAHSGHVH